MNQQFFSRLCVDDYEKNDSMIRHSLFSYILLFYVRRFDFWCINANARVFMQIFALFIVLKDSPFFLNLLTEYG